MRGSPWRSIVAVTLTAGTLLGAPAHAAPPGGGERAAAPDTRVPPSARTDAPRTHAVPRTSTWEARRASRTAYTDLSRSQAVSLAQRHFPELNRRGYTALDLEPGQRVAAWLGARAARITRPGEADLLLESQLPLRTLSESGAPTPVDLSLRDGEDGFAPLAPIVALEVGDQAHEGIALDDIGVSVAPVGVAEATGVARQDKAFFTDTAPDTDHIVTPLPTGVDLGAQLRSPTSPERFRWRLDLPAGARLQLSVDAPGAEIVGADGVKLAHITAPVAWDADDLQVKSTLAVSGDELVVDVAHREARVRYPVMLDPTILEDSAHWYANAAVPVDLSGWMWTDPGKRFGYFYGAAYLGNGLYTYNRGSTVFEAGDYANWYFNAPGTSRIVRADFGYVKHEPQTAGTWAAPYNDDRSYQGVWSYQQGRYESGRWCDLGEGGACGTSPFTTYGALHYASKTHYALEATPGNAAIFGTSVFYAGAHAPFTNFLGSASVWIEDVDAPAVTEDSGLSDQRWTSYRSFQARATDNGLGLRKLVVDSPGNPGWRGAYTYDANCTGDRRNRCPQVGYVHSDTTGLPEGLVPIRYTATDAVGNVSSRTWTIPIDRTSPSVVPDRHASPGATAPLEQDDDSVVVFEAEAEDAGAGVRSIDFELVAEWGSVVDESTDPDPQSCPEHGCPKYREWSVSAYLLMSGQYTLRTIATDQLGNRSVDERVVEVVRGIPPALR